MNPAHLLDPALVQMGFATPVPEPEEGETGLTPTQVRDFKEAVLAEIVTLFERSGQIGHANKLFRDLVNRERKATTAVGRGIAFPHVHTLQAKAMIVAVLVCPEGIPFDSPDGEPVHLLVSIVAPRDNDRIYLNLVRRFSEMFSGDVVLPEVLAARTAHEVTRILSSYL